MKKLEKYNRAAGYLLKSAGRSPPKGARLSSYKNSAQNNYAK